MGYKLFNEKSSATHKGTGINSENRQLAEELQKPVTRRFSKRKLCSALKTILGCWSCGYAINK